MVREITTASWGVCISLTSSSMKVITSLFYLFTGSAVVSLDKDSTSMRGLEQPPMMVCMASVVGQPVLDDDGMRTTKFYKDWVIIVRSQICHTSLLGWMTSIDDGSDDGVGCHEEDTVGVEAYRPWAMDIPRSEVLEAPHPLHAVCTVFFGSSPSSSTICCWWLNPRIPLVGE